MSFWENILSRLISNKTLCVLYVLHSEGSSPGRKGFKQFVTEDGEIVGSIGGGFMEMKLVELAKSLLDKKENSTFIRQQIHRTNIPANKSGMICSGEQTVAFYFLDHAAVPLVKEVIHQIENGKEAVLELNHDGIHILQGKKMDEPFYFERTDEEHWTYLEQLNFSNTIYIVGAGHVGLALSRTMHQLGFRVEIFDDRENLNTMLANRFASSKKVVSYDEIEKYIPEGNAVYVVIMTLGFRSDEVVLKRLIGRKYKYFGMLGSAEKVRRVFENLRGEGYSQSQLDSVFSPVGIPIYSKTPEEIAISIAAEIIREKNKP